MSVVYSHSLKYSEGEIRRNPEMDSNIGHPQQHCHQQNSALLRYRSAPSSLLNSLVDTSIGCVNEEAFKSEDPHHYHPSTSSEMETMLAKLFPSNIGLNNSEPLYEFGDKPVKQEIRDAVSQGPQHNGYSYGSQAQLIYQPHQIQGLSNGSLGASGNNFDGSFSAVSSMASDNSTETKMGSNNCSNLIRQKSSPAGFFSNYSVDNGLAALREVGSFRACDVSNGQATTSTSGLHGTLNMSSRPSSCSIRMPQIVENGNEGMEANCVESRNQGNNNGSSKCYMPSFTSDFWDGSSFSAPKTESNNSEIIFSTSNALETQDADFGYHKHGLTHHLSLPSSSTKMASMDNFFHIQGSVPCKIRAKRGFATHPRSIAERERRTRISARIKKLQDLFPKSDKQTSTADMLDVAVEYIKDLQKQVKVLTDTRAKCTCTNNQKQYSRPCA
ncbi:transcription factor bHLH130-like [Gastrolobium bilobum]|uniref:transcription factor bHLH130-like n=1 Tax=Gastrolobium bilobum TaxID=150636 RepID=UPI002AAFD670|nr:transcription factor bHLH130-like [Gastrolobium bilobum]